jgi:hypothetical protein
VLRIEENAFAKNAERKEKLPEEFNLKKCW